MVESSEMSICACRRSAGHINHAYCQNAWRELSATTNDRDLRRGREGQLKAVSQAFCTSLWDVVACMRESGPLRGVLDNRQGDEVAGAGSLRGRHDKGSGLCSLKGKFHAQKCQRTHLGAIYDR